MFPRNIRKIAPWKLHQALIILMKCSDLNLRSGEDQKYVYSMLDEAGIKKKGNTRDGNPGGMRTYLAQLSMLGLLYQDQEEQYRYTIAGQAVADGDNPLEVLQYQLLRHQYPSAYGLVLNVMIDPRMKVKPFMFLLRLFLDERLGGYLTCEDIAVPVIYGHNDDCYELCVEKILKARDADSIESVIDDFALDLYTPRAGFGKNTDNVLNIANTGKNYMEEAGLIVPVPKRRNKKAYAFNQNYLHIYERMKAESGQFLRCGDKSMAESFQRAYGRYDKQKDTRSGKELEVGKESPEAAFVQFRYVLHANDNLFVADDTAFYDSMSQMGIDSSTVAKAIAPYKAKRLSMDQNRFLEFANSGGQQANEFEKALVNLFISYGFDGCEWIGRKKSKFNWRGNFPDVLIRRKGCDEVGMADAKATSSYSLEHADMLKMKDTYVGSICELAPDATLGYFLYVAGGFKGDISRSLKQLEDATGVRVTAMDCRAVLRLGEKNWSAEKIENSVFKHGGIVTESILAFME